MKNDKKSAVDYDGGDGSYVVKNNRKLNIIAFVVCLLLAFFIWVYVMNVENSDYTKTFSVDVSVRGEDALYEATSLNVFGKPSAPVNITVQGIKADVEKYAPEDFIAYIDVSAIDKVGLASLIIVVETPSAAINVISVDPAAANIYIDYEATASIKLIPVSSSDSDLTFEASTDHIGISGAKAYVDKVAYATLTAHNTSVSDGNDSASPTDVRFYDANDVPVPSAYLTADVSGITVKVTDVGGLKG